MPRPTADVALLTDHRYTAAVATPDDWYLGNILADDGLLQAALRERGLSSVRLDWADPGVDWSRFGIAVFRTTWDYFDRQAEFMAWIERTASLTRLCNPAALVRWNIDKHYLGDLAAAGVPIVPTRYLERGDATPLAAHLEAAGWDQAIVKPCISGAARHTYRLDRDSAAAIEPVVRALLAGEAMMLQPFLPAILDQGEDTLVVIDGRYTHALRKRAKAGDFRVQDDYGGTLHACEPTPAQRALAAQAMAACPHAPAYGRVDMVHDAAGNPCVMELELIEPELWLRRHPPAAIAFADAIAARLDAGRGYGNQDTRDLRPGTAS
jgi:glutathione synthase/RimK-type ligase-like ATP-grasp enzyme